MDNAGDLPPIDNDMRLPMVTSPPRRTTRLVTTDGPAVALDNDDSVGITTTTNSTTTDLHTHDGSPTSIGGHETPPSPNRRLQRQQQRRGRPVTSDDTYITPLLTPPLPTMPTTPPLLQNGPTAMNNNSINNNSSTRSTGSSGRRKGFWQRIRSRRSRLLEDEEEEQQQRRAEELARRLHYAGDVLLERLFSYLSQLPDDDDEEEGVHEESINVGGRPEQQQQLQQGMTLPAAAVAWLSSQLYPSDRKGNVSRRRQRVPMEEEGEEEKDDDQRPEIEECCSIVSSFLPIEEHCHDADDGGGFHHHQRLWMGGTAQRDRVSLLRFLLPRVKLLRISRQPWPPPLPKRMQQQQQQQGNNNSSSRGRRPGPPAPPQHQSTPIRPRRPPSEELNCSTISSVSSTITMEAALLSSSPSIVNNNYNNNDPQGTTISPRQAFFQYMDKLEHSPTVDMRVFPRVRVLVLEGIPATWIVNLPVLQPTLQVLTVHRAAIYHLPSLFFSRDDKITEYNHSKNKKKKQQLKQHGLADDTPSSSSLLLPPRHYPQLTHLKLERCNLGERSGLVATISKLGSVQHLSLQYNEISSEQTALRALRLLPHLTQVDFRHNRISPSLPHAFLYLGGQLSVLKLSYNRLTTVRGLDRCYALQELWLDGNDFMTVQDVAGLARLPQLTYVRLQQNPFTTLGNSNFDPDWKVQLWTWFQEYRRAISPFELPVLVDENVSMNVGGSGARGSKGAAVTAREWAQILEGSFSNVTPTTNYVASMMVDTPTSGSLVAQTAASSIISTIPYVHARDSFMANSIADTFPVVPQTPTAIASVMTTTTPFEGSGTQVVETPSGGSSAPSPVLLLSPMRNRRVIKKGKTRRVMIQDDAAAVPPTTMVRSRQNGIQHSSSTGRKKPRRRRMVHVSDSAIQDTKLPAGSPMKDTSTPQNAVMSSYQKAKDEQRSLSFSLQDVLELLQEESKVEPSHSEQKSCDTNEDPRPENENASSIPTLDHLSISVMESEGPGKASDRRAKTTNPFDDEYDNIEPVLDIQLPSTIVGEEGSAPFAVLNVSVDDIPVINETNHPPPEVQNDDSDLVPELTSTDPDSMSSNFQSTADETVENAVDGEKKNPSADEGSQMSQKPTATSSPERIFPKPKVATVKLITGATARPFDVLSYDWDELIQRASAGLIPDGIPKVPIAILEQEIAKEVIKGIEVFPSETANLLADTAEPGTLVGRRGSNQSVVASCSASDPILDTDLSSIRLGATSLPDHVWQDDSSVLSSLGGSREDLPANGYNKFQLAEENSVYDGPESCREMKVVENLKLYFESFVFPTSVPDVPQSVIDELQVDDDDWQTLALHHPRIQLWPDDRRWLENVLETDSGQIADWASNRERFVRLWEEDLIPCGKAALRRLPPNRRIRLGFHGEKLFEGANLDAYTECRKVVLCLSTKALYVIVGEDNVTASHQLQAKKRRFPLPLDKDLSFRDAPWPHAVARHSLLDLEAVCIGFEFQRLTLRFRNPVLRKSDPFVYTLLTSNKKATVSILQDVQSIFKELSECTLTANRPSKKSSTLSIENDSNHVFDALNLAVSPDPLGTIVHYQIVQQQWKHGDRGTVRRICVVTDTKILLLDEDYKADGHRLTNITLKGDQMADVSYRIVDVGLLKQISEVEAAGSDPKAITISISPLSSLSRTHRWRLVCRDREGAERLVDDVRKALDMYQREGAF